MTSSETTMTRAQRAKVHALVRRNASLGSRTIPTTNQIRVFRKKAYLLQEEEEEEEEEEETEDEEYTPSNWENGRRPLRYARSNATEERGENQRGHREKEISRAQSTTSPELYSRRREKTRMVR